ncbi:MAG: hypothetical protein ACI906_003817 [Candidatus Latescibacterota bacterium]
MKKLLFLLLLPASLSAENNENRFRHDTFIALYETFITEEPAHSAELLSRLSRESRIPEKELRTRLIALIDTLEKERKNKSDTWKTLILQGEPDISPKRAGKLLHYLGVEGRKVLQGESDYLLDNGVRKAARKSKVPFFQSRNYILRSLDWALADDAGNQRKETVGLLVGGRSNRFEVSLDPLFIFFDTQDEEFVREQVREVQRFIIPAMVRRLPESERILWAVRERESNVLVEPDYHLVVSVDNFNFTGSNVDLKPCVELSVALSAWKSKSLLIQEPFEFCSETSGSANANDLAPFWNEAADALREYIVEFLAR